MFGHVAEAKHLIMKSETIVYFKDGKPFIEIVDLSLAALEAFLTFVGLQRHLIAFNNQK